MPLLNDAKMIYSGISAAKRVYLGGTLVWERWVPTNLSGLAIWLEAADYTNLLWPNKGSGAQPTFVGTGEAPIRSTNTLNGLPLVRFYNNNIRLRILSGAGMHLDWTVVYVGRLVAGGIAGRVVNAIYSPNNLLVGFWNYQKDVCYDNGFTQPDTANAWTPDWKMYSADGSDSPRLTRFFSNGVEMGSTATSQGWGNTFAISGYSPAGVEETCDCEVAEVCVYNRKLSDKDRQQVESYMRTKWGL